MLVVSSRFVESSVKASRMAEQRRAELARLDSLVSDARREASEVMEWAQSEAARIVDEARAEAAKLMAIETVDRPAVSDIIKMVAKRRCISTAIIIGPRRDRLAVEARFEALAMAYRMRPDLSTTQIGKAFGNRDHTSVIHAARKMGVWRGVPGEAPIEAMRRHNTKQQEPTP